MTKPKKDNPIQCNYCGEIIDENDFTPESLKTFKVNGLCHTCQIDFNMFVGNLETGNDLVE